MRVKVWLTKDNAGVLLWRCRPHWHALEQMFYNGGEAMRLHPECFSQLHENACVEVEIKLPKHLEALA